ncbi:uncharacterized protein F4812DRAFT_433976 [Daldinia caldariorum]|uniref:uncharacterized protein n=1 Tax=Daldinia caldariorum TaxID=326644 RepID=UPI002007CF17|nr:uncharacterized protein F4812DRAFT_433976 [Daldinia caldariorum]KAI1466414.1 hypothetical protein F4812DRAFT_433976 [Daldinia caldariorum]
MLCCAVLYWSTVISSSDNTLPQVALLSTYLLTSCHGILYLADKSCQSRTAGWMAGWMARYGALPDTLGITSLFQSERSP